MQNDMIFYDGSVIEKVSGKYISFSLRRSYELNRVPILSI